MKNTTTLLLIIACMLFANTSLMAQYTLSPTYKFQLPTSKTIIDIGGEYNPQKTILLTSDSAYFFENDTITPMVLPVSSNATLNCVTDYNDIFLVGSDNSGGIDSSFILHSINYGFSWDTISLPITNVIINDIVNYQNGFIAIGKIPSIGGVVIISDNAVTVGVDTIVDVLDFVDINHYSPYYLIAKKNNTSDTSIIYSMEYMNNNALVKKAEAENTLLSLNIWQEFSGDFVFASDDQGKIWVSKNSGLSWDDTIATPVSTPLRQITTRGGTFFEPAIIAITDSAVIYSEDTAKTWQIDNGFVGKESLYSLYSAPHVYSYFNYSGYVGGDNGVFYAFGALYSSIPEQNLIQFDLYPNPATEQTLIKAETVITNVEILDIFGRKVLSVEPNSKTHNLNLSSLASGNYIIHITTKQGYGVQKFVKN